MLFVGFFAVSAGIISCSPVLLCGPQDIPSQSDRNSQISSGHLEEAVKSKVKKSSAFAGKK